MRVAVAVPAAAVIRLAAPVVATLVAGTGVGLVERAPVAALPLVAALAFRVAGVTATAAVLHVDRRVNALALAAVVTVEAAPVGAAPLDRAAGVPGRSADLRLLATRLLFGAADLAALAQARATNAAQTALRRWAANVAAGRSAVRAAEPRRRHLPARAIGLALAADARLVRRAARQVLPTGGAPVRARPADAVDAPLAREAALAVGAVVPLAAGRVAAERVAAEAGVDALLPARAALAVEANAAALLFARVAATVVIRAAGIATPAALGAALFAVGPAHALLARLAALLVGVLGLARNAADLAVGRAAAVLLRHPLDRAALPDRSLRRRSSPVDWQQTPLQSRSGSFSVHAPALQRLQSPHSRPSRYAAATHCPSSQSWHGPQAVSSRLQQRPSQQVPPLGQPSTQRSFLGSHRVQPSHLAGTGSQRPRLRSHVPHLPQSRSARHFPAAASPARPTAARRPPASADSV